MSEPQTEEGRAFLSALRGLDIVGGSEGLPADLSVPIRAIEVAAQRSPVLDTIRGVGYIAQLQMDDGTWVSWTQYTTENGRTPEQARDLARTHVQRKLEIPGYVRGRVVRNDWIVEEIIDPVATDSGDEGPRREGHPVEAEPES